MPKHWTRRSVILGGAGLAALPSRGLSELTVETSLVPDAAQWGRIEKAMPERARVRPLRGRRLLIFNRNVEYQGHRSSILAGSEAFRQIGRRTGAFDVEISEDPAMFDRANLRRFDAVFLNNTIGVCVAEAERRKNLLEFVTGGGGLMGVHGTSIGFTNWQWPPVEDWPEFGHMLGARGANHRHGYVKEPIHLALDDAGHPLAQAFGGEGYPWTDEIFRFHAPYSRKNVRVLLTIDTEKTDLSSYAAGDPCLREDGDYALAWVRHYGAGRVFYSALAHSPHVFEDAKMLRFYLDGLQFVLGDLPAPTTPSAYLSPAVRAREALGWRIGVEAYTFHKYTLFEAIEKTGELGLPYVGGLSFMQQVSKDIQRNFDEELSDEEMRRIRLKMEEVGVRMLTYYAQKIPKDEGACRKLFAFGNAMGVETFLCEPQPDQLDLLDKLANEYRINVAIHNHGPNISPHCWQPEQVLALCEGRSQRLGAGPDVGYWLRHGIDPVEGVRILGNRILTVQMHDLHEEGEKGHDVPWGTGVGKAEAIFRAMHGQGVKPTMIGIEYSHDWYASMPKLAQSVAFFDDVCQNLTRDTHNKR